MLVQLKLLTNIHLELSLCFPVVSCSYTHVFLYTSYGDKIPRSPLGRIFSIIWILVGAILLSLFTATVTNAMNTALDGSKCKDVSGKEVRDN